MCCVHENAECFRLCLSLSLRCSVSEPYYTHTRAENRRVRHTCRMPPFLHCILNIRAHMSRDRVAKAAAAAVDPRATDAFCGCLHARMMVRAAAVPIVGLGARV